MLDGPRSDIGERLVRFVLGIWDSPAGRDRIVAVISGALTGEAVARMLREFIAREVLARIAGELHVDEPELRAALAASHLVGLALVRVVVQVEPLASASPEQVIARVAPVIQAYLTD